MRRATLATALVVGLASLTGPAAAAPAAGLVVVWAPGASDALPPVRAAARRAGATVLDTTPPSAPVAADQDALRAGHAAYDNLRFADAVTALTQAASSLDTTGGSGFSQHQLAEVFLVRALAAVQLGTPEAAWDDFVRAAVLAPTRVLDPAQFPPRAVEQFERARTHVAALPRLTVTLRREPRCAVAVDGVEVSQQELSLLRGRHYLVASCPGRLPVQRSFELLDALELQTAGAALAAPADDAALVQARALGVRALVVMTATSEAALLRRLAIDGREQARAMVQLGGAEGGKQLTRALDQLLQASDAPAPWYRSRWAWAAAGMLAASAVLVPLVLSSDDPPSVVIRPQGAPW